MIDFALDPRTKDLIIPLRPIEGADRIRQSVLIHLNTWLGEWFLDTSHGVPYLENVLGKNRRPEIVEAVIRAQILSVQGVKSIKSFIIDMQSPTRKTAITFSADTTEGLINGTLTLS